MAHAFLIAQKCFFSKLQNLEKSHSCLINIHTQIHTHDIDLLPRPWWHGTIGVIHLMGFEVHVILPINRSTVCYVQRMSVSYTAIM